MAWVKLEDGVVEHRKHLQAGPAACWLWVCGIAYCQRQLTNGFIPTEAIALLGVARGVKPLLAALVRVGLFDVVDGGYQVHDYLHHNSTKEEALKRRSDQHDAKVKAGIAGSRARWQTDSRPIADGNNRAMAPSHPIPSVQEERAAAAPRSLSPVENVRVITKLAHDVIDAEPKAGYADLKSDLKDACSRLRIAYDAEVAGKALESALAQRSAH